MSETITRRELLAGGAGLLTLASETGAQTPAAYDPTDRYAPKRVLGWTVLVNKSLEKEYARLTADVLRLLEFQLFQVTRVIPAPAVEKLRRVRIWVEYKEGHHPCMVYHPDPAWLREHAMNPDKAKCVEIAGAETFLAWTLQQPWMVLHELAHAYHDQMLPQGFDNAEVRAAYDAAVKAGRYVSVLRWSGAMEKHYALTNPQEYFAEATEAYFGTNDYYPFVRPELKEHDPEGYRVVRRVWGVAE
jgi:hypothetical protein